MTPDQLQWVLDHNMQIRAGHRVQIADAVKAWRADQAKRDELLAALRKVRAHTSYVNPSLELLQGLLQSIERIADAAINLSDPPLSSE